MFNPYGPSGSYLNAPNHYMTPNYTPPPMANNGFGGPYTTGNRLTNDFLSNGTTYGYGQSPIVSNGLGGPYTAGSRFPGAPGGIPSYGHSQFPIVSNGLGGPYTAGSQFPGAPGGIPPYGHNQLPVTSNNAFGGPYAAAGSRLAGDCGPGAAINSRHHPPGYPIPLTGNIGSNASSPYGHHPPGYPISPTGNIGGYASSLYGYNKASFPYQTAGFPYQSSQHAQHAQLPPTNESRKFGEQKDNKTCKKKKLFEIISSLSDEITDILQETYDMYSSDFGDNKLPARTFNE